jgi:flagellar biosynthesis protein FlhG
LVNFDQAEGLRRMLFNTKPRFVTFLSALSNEERNATLVNLSAGLSALGHDVVLMDARVSGASAAKWLEAPLKTTLIDVLRQKRSVKEATMSTAQGFKLASYCRSQFSTEYFQASDAVLTKLNKIIVSLGNSVDIVLVDGELNDDNKLVSEVLEDGEIVIQVTNHPDSIKAAYGLIKRAHSHFGQRDYGVLVTGVTEMEAHRVFDALAHVAGNFLSVSLNLTGFVPDDDFLRRASRSGRAVIDVFPKAGASVAFSRLAQQLSGFSEFATSPI